MVSTVSERIGDENRGGRMVKIAGADQLGGLDSNQDKQNQNLLCYRYTTPEEEHAGGEIIAS